MAYLDENKPHPYFCVEMIRINSYWLIVILVLQGVFPHLLSGQSQQTPFLLKDGDTTTNQLSAHQIKDHSVWTNPKIDSCLNLAKELANDHTSQAINLAQTALFQAQQNNYGEGKASAQLVLGQILLQIGLYSKALDHLFQALGQFKLYHHTEGQAQTLNAIGRLQYYLHKEDEALAYHQQALELCRSNELTEQEAMTLGFIGHHYEKTGNYTKALDFQQQAFQLYDQLQSTEGLSTIYGHIGSIYEDLAEYETAYEYFQKGLEHNRQTDDIEERIILLNNISDTYRKRAQYEKALEITNQALALARQAKQKYQEQSALKDLAKIYQSMGAFEKAFFHLSQSVALYTSIYDDESARQIANLEALHELNAKQNAIDQLQQEQQISNIIRNSMIVGILLVVLLAWFIYRNQQFKNQRNIERYDAQQALIKVELEKAQLSKQKLQSEVEANANQLTNHALHIFQKNKMLKELKTKLRHLKQNHTSLEKPVSQLINKINESFNFDQDWDDFQQTFEQVHADFYIALNERFPNLTASEIRLCALLKLNIDSKDMSTILGISPDSLRVARYRLRQKLNLEKGTNLTNFIMKI